MPLYLSMIFLQREPQHYSWEMSVPIIAPGTSVQWAGQLQSLKDAEQRLKIVVPLTILVIFLLIYLNTRSAVKTFIVLLVVPFSLVGAFCFVYLLGYNMSVAVWVGLIALAGLDGETGVLVARTSASE